MWSDVEVGLGSPGRIRILRVLLKKPGERFAKYALGRLTGLKPVDVRRDLNVLVGLGWIKENPYNPRIPLSVLVFLKILAPSTLQTYLKPVSTERMPPMFLAVLEMYSLAFMK